MSDFYNNVVFFVFYLLCILTRSIKQPSTAKISILICVHWVYVGVVLLAVAIGTEMWPIYNALKISFSSHTFNGEILEFGVWSFQSSQVCWAHSSHMDWVRTCCNYSSYSWEPLWLQGLILMPQSCRQRQGLEEKQFHEWIKQNHQHKYSFNTK